MEVERNSVVAFNGHKFSNFRRFNLIDSAMSQDLSQQVKDITIGVRFQRSFRVKDVLGAITDQLISHADSPLVDYFEEQSQNMSEMTLINRDGAYLRVNTDDIILKYIVKNSLTEEIAILKNYLSYVGKILKQYNIFNILRIGVVYTHSLEISQDKIIKLIEELTNNKISSPDDFSISFSQKLPTHQGYVKEGVNDYKNVIYSFKKTGKTTLMIGLDYQEYFDPPQEKISTDVGNNFLDNSKAYLIDTFYKSLNINHEQTT